MKMIKSATPSNDGISQKLFSSMCERIACGEWPIGSPLPSVRSLAQTYGTSVATVQRTIARLEAQKLIECNPGRKSIVRAHGSRVVRHAVMPGMRVVVISQIEQYGDLEKIQNDSSLGTWGLEIRSSFEAVLHERGIQVVLASYLKENFIDSLGKQFDHLGPKMAGAIFFPGRAADHMEQVLENHVVPALTINRTSQQWTYNFVTTDFFGAGRNVGDLFAKSGFERTLLIGPTEGISFQELSTGLVQAYLMNDMSVSQLGFVTSPTGPPEMVAQIVRDYIEQHGAPQGIFASSDKQALAAILACRQCGLSVPDDVSVVSALDSELAQHTDSSLTAIAQPTREIGEQIGRLLIEMIESERHQVPGVVIPAPLMLRDTTSVNTSLCEELKLNLFDNAPVEHV